MKMHLELSSEEILQIKGIIEHQENKMCTVDNSLSTIWIHDKHYETEFRFCFNGHFKLVISRVCFVNRRCGTMTKLLEKMKGFCNKYDVHNITIQSVETPEMVNFCIKNGFSPSSNASFTLNGITLGDYVLTA